MHLRMRMESMHPTVLLFLLPRSFLPAGLLLGWKWWMIAMFRDLKVELEESWVEPNDDWIEREVRSTMGKSVEFEMKTPKMSS